MDWVGWGAAGGGAANAPPIVPRGGVGVTRCGAIGSCVAGE